MEPFVRELGVIELLLPAVCSGVALLGLVFLIYIYRVFNQKLYLAMIYMSVCALVFVTSEIFILALGGWYRLPDIAVQFHRTEQLAGAYFLFAFPYLMYYMLAMGHVLRKITIYLAYSGLAFAIFVTFCAFIFPDFFISMTEKNAVWLEIAAEHGRGREGPLYFARDAALAFLIIYSFFLIIVDMVKNRNMGYMVLPLIGILLGIAGAVDDIYYVHSGSYIGIFTDIPYSRFSVGLTAFVSLSIANITWHFTNQAKEVEKAYRSLDSAYKTLHNSEARFRQITENISECIIVWDYINNLVQYVSPAYEDITGFSCEGFYNDPMAWSAMIHPDDREEAVRILAPGNIRDREDMQLRIIRKDGTIRWVRHQTSAIKDKNGNVYRLILILEDITERKRNEEELFYVAYHDILTGLPNRRAFFERFQDMILQSKRTDVSIKKAVFFIDLDRFKNINDIMGHKFGDMLLKMIPDRIQDCLRGTDYLFHLGGDEFTIILYGIKEDIDAAVVARKLLEEFSKPFELNEKEIFLGLSIGVSIFPRDGEQVDVLVKNADIAMNDAKTEGNTFRFFNEEMNRQALEKLNIENNLRGAIDKNQFLLYYQPVIDINYNIIGMEALIRWDHPELGFVPPDRFIPIAETTGHIIDIGLWTLDTACRQINTWREAGYGDIQVAVNLSANHLMYDSLLNDVESVIKKYDMDPGALVLEITESAVMKEPDEAVNIIKRLSEMGIRFSVDDFGTGYSSLSYLKKFRISHLKIDRSFIRDINIDQSNTEITKAIIAMAHNLRLQVIAEGIETIEQMEFLKGIDCDFMQGYLFSRPVPADEIEEFLKKGVKF